LSGVENSTLFLLYQLMLYRKYAV